MYKNLQIVYIVPSRYDDDGYAVRWTRGVVPSNSLAVLKALTEEVVTSRVNAAPLNIVFYDDNIEKIPFRKIARQNTADTKVLVGIVGVQSNQFCRASDIALKFRQLGIDTMIGGFHVTGIMNLFDEPTPELKTLIDNKVTLVVGEVETPGTLDGIFADALNDHLQPIYRTPKAPDLTNAVPPKADPKYIDHFGARWATMDSSRGCPFNCSFCTVINIQGRKMRCRSSEKVLEAVQTNCRNGVKHFFFTDDNFARSAHWEAVFDGLTEMRRQGETLGFMMQIDTQAAKIPGFVEKAKTAGCRMVFIGMESVNPANIESAGKTQNKVEQYREMVQRWQNADVIVHVGYIIGFPNDTVDSVQRDVVFLRDNVGVDLASFFMMTPLPGSVNHKNMLLDNFWIDPDLNKYDSFHETFRHPLMPDGEWKRACQIAYNEFYTKEHCAAILSRLPKEHYWLMFWNLIWYRYSGVLSGTHPMMTGFFRKKDRRDRRPGLPIESRWTFFKRWVKDFVLDAHSYFKLFFEFQEIWFLTRKKAVLREAACSTKTNTVYKNDYLAPLAALKRRWTYLKQQVAEYNWQGHYGAAVQELSNALLAVKSQLTNKLFVTAIDECLTELAQEPVTPELVYRAENSIHTKIIMRYENLATKYVKMRREVNLWKRNAVDRLKSGKVIRSGAGLMKRPWLAFVEGYLSMRFCIAAARKEV